jgi:hypothetical protein
MGTRYVVENSNGTDVTGNPWPQAGTQPWPVGPRLVYRGRLAEIWELPHPKPLFSVASANGQGASCTVSIHGPDSAKVTCAHPLVLVRREQFIPGWSASINGRAVSVRKATTGPAGLFQQVDVPAGTSTVRFTFLPPHEFSAFIAAGLALAVLVGSFFLVRKGRARLSPSGSDRTGLGGQRHAMGAGRRIDPDEHARPHRVAPLTTLTAKPS